MTKSVNRLSFIARCRERERERERERCRSIDGAAAKPKPPLTQSHTHTHTHADVRKSDHLVGRCDILIGSFFVCFVLAPLDTKDQETKTSGAVVVVGDVQ